MAMLKLKIVAALASTACAITTAQAQDITALDSRSSLVIVSSTAPTTVRRTVAVTGLGAGQTLVALDGRPAANGRTLYALSNTGQLYAINPRTGVASTIGAPTALQGTAFGLDFNPVVDRIRVVSDTGQNLRINPDTGVAIVDSALNVSVGGQPIGVNGNTAAAYANNVAGATTTTLYVVNTQTGALQIQNPPNSGTLTFVGGTGGLASGTVSGFDISRTGEARLTVTQNGVTTLFSVNLATGAATPIGIFGVSGAYQGLAYLPVAFADTAGLSANQSAVAGTLDNFTSVATGFVPLLTAIDALPNDAARGDAFRQLGPVDYGILPELVLQTNEFVDGTLRRHLRNAGEAQDSGKLGGFLIGTARTGELESEGDRGEVKYGSFGVIGGLDYRIAPNVLIGVAGGYDQTDASLNAISPKSRVETVFGGAYATVGVGIVSVDLVGSYGETDFDLERNVAFGAFASGATAQTDGRYYGVSGTVRATFDLGSLAVEPYVGGRYADVDIKGFSEGPGLTSLTVRKQQLESIQSVAGLRVKKDFDTGGAVIKTSVQGEYRREFKNDEARSLIASFNGTGISTPFSTTTTPFGKDYFVGGAELAITGDSPVEVIVNYNGQFSGGYNIHAIQGGVRIKF